MTQIPLLNYQILATTKAVNFAKRVREQASTLNKSVKIAESKSPVPNAASKPLPQNVSTKSSRETEAEFNLPDEDRDLVDLWKKGMRCKCGYAGVLERRSGKYRVRCKRESMREEHGILPDIGCPQPTPWLDSSAAAIRVWTITQKLTQL